MTLNDPYPGFKVTPFLMLNISEMVRYTDIVQWNTYRDLHTTYSTVSF